MPINQPARWIYFLCGRHPWATASMAPRQNRSTQDPPPCLHLRPRPVITLTKPLLRKATGTSLTGTNAEVVSTLKKSCQRSSPNTHWNQRAILPIAVSSTTSLFFARYEVLLNSCDAKYAKARNLWNCWTKRGPRLPRKVQRHRRGNAGQIRWIRMCLWRLLCTSPVIWPSCWRTVCWLLQLPLRWRTTSSWSKTLCSVWTG